MARIEIRDPVRGSSVVELDDRPLAIGFDDDGRPAWGERAVNGVVGEVRGDRLRRGDTERRLRAGERVAVEGIELVYRPDDARVAGDYAQVLRDVGRVLASEEDADVRLDACSVPSSEPCPCGARPSPCWTTTSAWACAPISATPARSSRP